MEGREQNRSVFFVGISEENIGGEYRRRISEENIVCTYQVVATQ